MLAFADSCPHCGGAWDARPELLGKPASDFTSCAFRCHRCGLGFSNAQSPAARVPITATPELNVPPEARPGLQEALAGAINVHNRPVKAKKFCSGRSEDAVTWTVVAGLRATGAIGALVGQLELGTPQALLLWGHPVAGERAEEVREVLEAISDGLGEHHDRRTEPDVIALWRDLLVFVEAKHGSANDSQPHYAGYSTYLPAPGLFAAADEPVRAEGSYQLARNWVIGAALADRLGAGFRLVNLGPASIAEHAAGFAALLEQTPQRRFEHRIWRQVLQASAPMRWLDSYATSHGLSSYHPVPVVWPDEALEQRADSIGPALQRLIDHEARWIHRRVERIELASPTEVVRKVAADLTVPAALGDDLRYDAKLPGRLVVPLGVLPKEPLVDFTLEPKEVQRLTADQANPLVVGAITKLAEQTAEQTGASLERVLDLLRIIIRDERPGGSSRPATTTIPIALRIIIRDERPGGNAGSKAYQRLVQVVGPVLEDSPAGRLLERARELDANYVLLAVLPIAAGAATRVTYTHRQRVKSTSGGVDDPPLEIDVELPHASGRQGPAYRVELAAPDGLEIEAASMVAVSGEHARVIVPGEVRGPFVQLRAPDPADRPDRARLQATFGFESGGVHQLATIAGAASTAALAIAVWASYGLDAMMKSGSASMFLAGPALVTGLVLGFATTSVTSRPVNRLRAAAFAIALFGVLGGLTVALLGENPDHLNLRHGILIALTCASALVSAGYPLRAWLRVHDRGSHPARVPH